MSEKNTKRKYREKHTSTDSPPTNENNYKSNKDELSSYLNDIKNLINNNEKNDPSSLLEKLNSIFNQISNLFEKLLTELINTYSQYESRTKLNEQIIRKLHSDVFFEKTANECLENKMAKLIQKQNEFEEIKEKMGVIFCDGQIIHNERKENEILILRTENSNLKNYIEKSEQNLKKKDDEINTLNQKIALLSSDIQKLKQNKGTIQIKSPQIGQSFSNININFNEIQEINSSRVIDKRGNNQKNGNDKCNTLFQTFSSKFKPNPSTISSAKQKYLNVRNHNKNVSKERIDTSQIYKNNYELSTDNNSNKFITVKKVNANPLSTRLLKKKKYLNFRTVSQELNLQINQTSKNMENKKLLYGKKINNKVPINSESYLSNLSKNNEEIITFCNSTRNNKNKHEIVMTDRDSKVPKIKFPSKYLEFKKDGELTKNNNRVFHKKNNSSMFQMSVTGKKYKK